MSYLANRNVSIFNSTVSASTLSVQSAQIALGLSTSQTHANFSNGSFTTGWVSTLSSVTSTVKVSMSQSGANQVALLAGTSTMYTSANSGQTWTTLTGANGLPAGATAYPLATAAGTPNWSSHSMSATGQYRLASVNGGLIYTTANSGATWTAAGMGAPTIYLPMESSTADVMGAATVTATGSPGYVTGIVGTKAINFSNTVSGTGTQYITITPSPTLSPSAFTFSFWMNLQTVNGAQQDIFFNTSGTLGFYLNTSNQLAFLVPNGGAGSAINCAITTFSLIANTWYNITAIFQANSTCSMYVNNVLIGTAVQTGGMGTSSYSSFTLGSFGTITPTNAYIDDFRLYNSAVAFSPITPMNWSNTAVSATGQYMLAAANNGGLFMSSNYGQTWSQVQTTLQTAAWTGLSMSATGQYQIAMSGGQTSPNQSGLAASSWSQNGVQWTASASSVVATNGPALAFNNTVTGNGWIANQTYNSSGVYIGSVITQVLGGVGNISGEWLQIQSSISQVMQSYTFGACGSYTDVPKSYYIVGSTDAANWYPIQFCSMATNPFTAVNTLCSTYITVNQSGTQTIIAGQTGSGTFTTYSSTTQAYIYFRLITQTTWNTSGTSYLNIGEFMPIFLAGESYSTNYGQTWSPQLTYGSDAFNIVKAAYLTKSLSAYVTLPGYTLTSAGLSVSVWFTLTATPSLYTRILDFAAGGVTALAISFNTSYIVVTGATTAITSTTTFATNTLYHLVYTLASNGNQTLYVNGASNATAAGTLTPITYAYGYLGKSTNGDPYNDINISDFRMYSRAISAAEVTALYAANYAPTQNPVPNQTGLAVSSWSQSGVSWTVSASSNSTPSYPAYKAFNNTVSSGDASWISANNYSSAGGTFGGSSTNTVILGGVGTIYGDYIQLQTSAPLILQTYTYACGGYQNLPKIYYIVGSTDATNWYPIQYASMTTNPLNTTWSSCSTNIIVNQSGTQTITGNVTGSGTFTTYSTTTNAYTYFRIIATTVYSNSPGYYEFAEFYPNFSYPAPSIAYTFSAISGNGQYSLAGSGQTAFLTTTTPTTLSASAGTLVTLPSINANINCASISGTGQYMTILTQGTTNNVFYSTNYGQSFTALTVGSTPMTGCAISTDGSYITVSNATTVYTLNWNTAGYTIAVGNLAGQTNQSQNAIAIGNQSAQTNQPQNSIVLNATGAALNAYDQGFYVAPIANALTATTAAGQTSSYSVLGYGQDSQIVQSSHSFQNSQQTIYGEWIQYQLATSTPITGYTLAPRTSLPMRSPAAWYVLGSTDGVTWWIVDRQTNTGGWGTYTLPYQSATYSYYRIIFTQLTSTLYLDIGNWTLLNGNPVFGSYTNYTVLASGIYNVLQYNGVTVCTTTFSWPNTALVNPMGIVSDGTSSVSYYSAYLPTVNSNQIATNFLGFSVTSTGPTYEYNANYIATQGTATVANQSLFSGMNIAGALTTTGAVGIGSTAPQYSLDVAGTAQVNGPLTTADNGIPANSSVYATMGQNWLLQTGLSTSLAWGSCACSATGQYQTVASGYNLGAGVIWYSSNYGQSWGQATITGAVYNNMGMSGSGQYQLVGVNAPNSALYLSTNYGQTWAATGTLSGSGASWTTATLSYSGQYMYACAYSGSIYSSSNYGGTFAATSASALGWNGICCSSSGQYITAVVYNGGIYYSTNYGQTWSASTGFGNSNWNGCAMSQNGQYQYARIGGTGGVIYASTNYGASWFATYSPSIPWSAMSCSASGQYIMACASTGVMYYSTNYGASWVASSSPSTTWTGLAMSQSGQYIVGVISGGAVYTSQLSNLGLLTNGRIGVGTTTPQYTLQVLSNSPPSASYQSISMPTTTAGSFLRNVIYGTTDRVDIEVGSSNTGMGNLSCVYKYTMGMYTSGSTAGGDFQINAVTCSSTAYSGADTRVTRLAINNVGNVGIGTAAPAYQLNLYGPSPGILFSASGYLSNQWYLFVGTNNGAIFLGPNVSNGTPGCNVAIGASAWAATSDRRLKKNISPLPSALNNILQLNPVLFQYKNDSDQEELREGFIAQEIQPIFPSKWIVSDTGMPDVQTDENGNQYHALSVAPTQLIPHMVKALQEQHAIIKDQAATIASLLSWAQSQGFSQ